MAEKTLAVEDVMAGLIAKVEALEAELAKSRQKVLPDEVTVAIRREDHPEAGGGWLVRTVRDDYDGVTHGVRFSGGLAVVDEDTENGDWIVNRLEFDFGYEVRAIQAGDVAEVRKLMAKAAGKARARQGSAAEKMAVGARKFQ